MSFSSLIIASDAEAQSVMGETCVIGGATYSCVPGEQMFEPELERGGYDQRERITLSLTASQFAARPSRGTVATYNGRSYYVDEVREDFSCYLVTLIGQDG